MVDAAAVVDVVEMSVWDVESIPDNVVCDVNDNKEVSLECSL